MSDLHKSTCPTILPACNCDLPLAERQFVAAALGDPAAVLAAQRPEGVTLTEWRVTYLNPDVEDVFATEAEARQFGARWKGSRYTSRQRTTFPDVVTEWAEVPSDTEAGNGSSCCPGAGTMAHVRGCRNHPEAGGPR